jgi:predicted regulator of Ras-like GTPase activity (Roadblock/LC7/MglB family)
MYEDEAPKKILIAGLPGAGLRTIKSVVVDNNPPDELKKVVEKLEIGNTLRDILQRKVLVVRCGGDEALQDVLDRDNDPIYQNVEAFVFVIDLFEQSNFSIAKYWFDALVKHVHKFSVDAKIYLLMHKVDLLAKNERISEYIRATKNLFNIKGIDIYVHETSIFDFSIYVAFKDVLMKEDDDHISVKQFLNRFIKGSSFKGLGVFSHDGLPIYEAGSLPPFVQLSANVILGSVSRIKSELDKDDEVNSTILQMKKNSFIIIRNVNENGIFVGLTKRRPKMGQMLVETDEIVSMLQRAMK